MLSVKISPGKIHLQWLLFALLFSFASAGFAQDSNPAKTIDTLAPAVLPGSGLAQFDFFYAGEAKSRNMYIVRKGKIAWSYLDSAGKGEISDAILMSNGNILFAHQFAVTLIDSNKKVLWNHDAPDGFEIHTAQPIGSDRVLFVQNGHPASVVVMNIKSNTIEKTFPLPFKSDTHGQIRHARLTPAGTLLVAHMDLGKVCEYDVSGKTIFSVDVPSVWSAVPLHNGHILVTSNQGFVREIKRDGSIVWDYQLAEIKNYSIKNPQLAVRLNNGNTLINNWFNQWSTAFDADRMPVQAIVVTPGKKIIWAMRSWKGNENLGPSTTIQLLKGAEQPAAKTHFGNIQ